MVSPAIISHRTAAFLGLILSLPAALFVSAQVLKYELGAPFLYDALGFLSSPARYPLYDALSPVIFVGGTLAAVMLNAWMVLRVGVRREDDTIVGTFTLVPKAANLSVIVLAGSVLMILVTYLVVENLSHV